MPRGHMETIDVDGMAHEVKGAVVLANAPATTGDYPAERIDALTTLGTRWRQPTDQPKPNA